MKKALLGAATLIALPMAAANAQSDWFAPGQSFPGVYIGAEGGLNWLLNSGNYNMDLGYAAGGKVGYDFVGPRVYLNDPDQYPLSIAIQTFQAAHKTDWPLSMAASTVITSKASRPMVSRRCRKPSTA